MYSINSFTTAVGLYAWAQLDSLADTLAHNLGPDQRSQAGMTKVVALQAVPICTCQIQHHSQVQNCSRTASMFERLKNGLDLRGVVSVHDIDDRTERIVYITEERHWIHANITNRSCLL
jgi:hypothetical protein